MAEKILTALSGVIIAVIAAWGYNGVILMMALESACMPLPSEVIMPFSGYLVATGRFGLQPVALAGTLGCLLGSYLAYFAGATGARPLLERYGRFVLIAPGELGMAERFFARWGGPAVLLGRVLPVVRTFIALPAGIAHMELWRFSIYTVVGSYPWCLALAYAGMKLGQHWSALAPYFRRFDSAFALLLALGVAAFLYNRLHTVYHHSGGESA